MTSGFDSICGSPLWEDENATSPITDDANATDTQPFVFSECFQNTVFVWVPCAYLAVISPIYFYILIRKYDRVIRLGPLNLAKLVCGCLLMAVCAAAMFYRVHLHQQGEPLYPAMLLAPAINFVAMLLATILIEFGRKKGVRSTGVLFVYWFLQTIAGVLTLTATVQQAVLQGGVSSVFHLTMTVLFSLLVFVELILSSCVDRPPDSLIPTPQGQLPPCPETEASFLSNITFWWFTSLIVTGYKKSLEMKDLWLLNPEDNAKEIVPMFETHWKKELEKSQRSRDRLSPREDKEEGIPLHPKKSTEIDEKGNSSMDASPPRVTFKTAGEEKSSEDGGKGCCGCSRKVYKPSLSWALVQAYGGTFFMGSLFKFVHDILMFVSPMLLRELIAFTENKSVPSWKGYTYTFLLFGVAFIQSLILHQYFQRCFVTGMRLRTSIIGTVYKKALKLSNAARRTSTVGEIVNLMSVDAQRFMDLTTYVNMLWSGPFQMCVSLYFLWYTLGPSILAGVAVMILLIPVNAFIAKKNRALQAIQMVHKDSRIKLMNEILNGIKVLKLYAWETSFQQKVLGIRSEELKVMKKSAYLNATSSFTWTCAPFLVCLTTFAVYVLSSEDNILDAEKAFVSLSLFNILRFPMAMLPNTIAGLVQVTVSIKRLRTFLLHEELDPDNVQRVVTGSNAIVIEDATFAWDTESHRAPPPETETNVDKKDEDDKDTEEDDDKPAVTEEGRVTLQDLNMTIPDGHLVAVVGVVGSGKSSLLSAILGEMEKLRGKVMVKGSVAYVAQQAWIQNAALRDNVLFGRPRAEPEYGQLLDACALAPDLEVLPGGDMTEIGEKGINLSGGQKQRVSLARAVYQDADIYLLDDPLSAVDAHVGKHIFEKVLGPNGILKKKTRLLVTHGISYLPQTDLILVVKDGRVSERGTYRELLDHDGAFAEFLRTYLEQEMMREDEEEEDEMDEAELTIREEILSHIHIGSPKDDTFLSGSREKLNRIRKDTIKSTGSCNTPSLRRRKDPVRSLSSGSEKGSSLHGSRSSLMRHDAKAKEAMANGLGDGNKGEKIIKEETTETGRVKLSVLTAYLRSMRLPICVLIMVLYMVTNGMSLASNFWLSIWSNDKRINGTVDTDLRDMRLGVYGALGLAQGISLLISSFALAIGNIAASVSLHRALLHNILRSPMEFFDVTPVGRVVNRFSKEIDILDTMIPRTLEAFIKCCLHVLECVIVISISTPIFLIIIVPIGIFYFLIQRFYVATSRQLKRLESVSRSPIYSHFGETVQGASTIRAYRQQARFIRESEEAVDKNQICYYPGIVANRWLAVRLEFVGNVIVLFSSLFAVIYRDDLTAGIVGLSISYALNITQVLNWTVRMASELETNIVSVERIKEYTQTAMEADWDREDTRPDPSWPDKGQLEFKEYSTRYREGLDLVLKDISCNIQPNEKVGIVGRTGAGKSSLTVALFRIIESDGGSISIDGVNIADLGLHDLRSKLTIIPQDPVLFSGSLRMNLDPFDQFSDSDVWAALEHAHLKNYVSSLAEGLQYECTEGGENLSVGQRQLICLARALLRKSRILVLDEATAAVDLETDDLIQSTIREEFSHSTVLTIAHRLNTIMDYNRIIVLDGGRISEMDTPQALLASKTSAFYGMAKDAGLAE